MPGEFIDTNIVIYTLSKDEYKQKKSIELLAAMPVMSVQVLSETANIMKRKLGFDVPLYAQSSIVLTKNVAYYNRLP